MKQSGEHVAAIAAVALVVIGSSTLDILPLLVTGAVDKLGFATRQIGVMSSILTAGSGLSLLLVGLWIRSLSISRAAATALSGMCLCLLLAMRARTYWAFVSTEAAAAAFGSAAFALGMAIISDRYQSSRGFGVLISVQAAYQIIVLYAGPYLLRSFAGVDGVLAAVAAPAAVVILLTPLLRIHGPTIPASSGVALMRPSTLLALLSFGTYYMGIGAYWTYIELMGRAEGIAAHFVADCVALSVAAGIPGGLLAAAQGNRFGNLWSLLFAACFTVIAAALVGWAHGVLAFGLGGLLYFGSSYYAFAYQSAVINSVDTTRVAIPVSGAFSLFGATSGAALAALFVAPDNYHAVPCIVIITGCVSVLGYVLSSLMHRQSLFPDRQACTMKRPSTFVIAARTRMFRKGTSVTTAFDSQWERADTRNALEQTPAITNDGHTREPGSADATASARRRSRRQ